MDTIEELITEIPLIRFGELSVAGMNMSLAVAVLALVFLVLLMVRGYKNGILVELSPLAALIVSVVALYLSASHVNRLIPVRIGRLPRAFVLLCISVLVYMLVKKLLKGAGTLIRKLPLVGWLAGILGALGGLIEALCVLALIQKCFGLDVFGALRDALIFLNIL